MDKHNFKAGDRVILDEDDRTYLIDIVLDPFDGLIGQFSFGTYITILPERMEKLNV